MGIFKRSYMADKVFENIFLRFRIGFLNLTSLA